jgi:GTP diphosphokinase / guanosine-3',5'-bis(diphosphate) 3'-diphosphatase
MSTSIDFSLYSDERSILSEREAGWKPALNRHKILLDMISPDTSLILKAVKFSADKHRSQRRKDRDASPYINHPIEVAEMLLRVGQVADPAIIVAALLHDTIEDTKTTPEEIEKEFGSNVLSLVMEVTDDKSLPKQERKELQVKTAPHKSFGAKQIKIADKISNLRDITHFPPADWSVQRRSEYIDWSERVVAGLRGVNAPLEKLYDQVLAEARQKLANAST